MLKNRVITALLLGPLVIAAIWFLPIGGFAVFWGAIILAGAWEWANLSGLYHLPARLGFVGLVLVLLLAARYFAIYWAPGELPGWFYWSVVGWWFLWGIAFRRMPERLVKIKYPLFAKLAAGLFVLVTGWILMVWLRLNFHQEQVLYLVLLIWSADAAAYFVGKRWGHTKLLEPISPGKTVEGVYGALFVTAILATAVGIFMKLEAISLADFVFLSLFTVAVSVCGDLFESLAKRVRGVKDSGAILPGHGGVLDRIDSLLAAVSVFYAGSLVLGIFLAAGLEASVVIPQDMVAESPGATVLHEYEEITDEEGMASEADTEGNQVNKEGAPLDEGAP
ncbi:phosphatidate cytidylyltransferase [Methylocaldum szegediense]|uniref:Phosphatidate cytidylyltransferase n=1 Tax=Methylocaldum szegediense TaxID=73780 RepID=A0ABN8XBB1_9GAMM|nr:phosphatidate cytidylyltransferase [Methylocaldum szegediense]CAI8910166.1 phosphatidate cytidylyltransferase [Methylocaldum szegediense]